MDDSIEEMINQASFDDNGYSESGEYTLHLDEVGFVQVYHWQDNAPVLVRDQKR